MGIEREKGGLDERIKMQVKATDYNEVNVLI